ncbi:hypothetical protein Tco_0684109 [Tanacetum coccineum]
MDCLCACFIALIEIGVGIGGGAFRSLCRRCCEYIRVFCGAVTVGAVLWGAWCETEGRVSGLWSLFWRVTRWSAGVGRCLLRGEDTAFSRPDERSGSYHTQSDRDHGGEESFLSAEDTRNSVVYQRLLEQVGAYCGDIANVICLTCAFLAMHSLILMCKELRNIDVSRDISERSRRFARNEERLSLSHEQSGVCIYDHYMDAVNEVTVFCLSELGVTYRFSDRKLNTREKCEMVVVDDIRDSRRR